MRRVCATCRVELPEGTPGERCPKCLLELGLGETMQEVDSKPGDWIGRYKLLQQIGEGGMGVVYMAEQREPMIRKVALKIIKLGMDSKQVVARFEAERQALAMMDHPNIAKVLDGGMTESGRPYFVMDLVQGLPITQFCDEAKHSTRERLDLFLDVCSAIQHAHQKGIIHRDIKPSNILVTLHGDKTVPKVIDFGIAKATQQRLTEKTLFTQFQNFIGTPAYMSPEQASLSGLDIDTRSDIYALGVLLYELLTGKTPFDGKELLKSGLDEMRRTIKEKEPPRPSARLHELQREELTTTAQRRNMDGVKLLHLVRGDLDWIVMKCLEKDRTRRYETATGLAADVRRHLNNDAVVARPPNPIYRARKALARHKLAITAAGLVMVSLAVGVTVSTWSLFKEKDAHRRAVAAEREQRQLRATAEAALRRAEAGQTALLYWQAFEALPKPAEAALRDIAAAEELAAEQLGPLAAKYDRSFQLLRRATDIGSGCNWAVNMADGPYRWTPKFLLVRQMAAAARLRAKHALVRDDRENARQELVAAFILGRHVAVDGSLVAVMAQVEVESQTAEFAAQNFFRFTPSGFAALAQAIDSAPPRIPVGRGLDREAGFPQWLIRRVGEVAASAGDENKAVPKINELLGEIWDQRRATEVIQAGGGRTASLIEYIKQAIPFYDATKAIATASPENLDREADRATVQIEDTTNLVARWCIPNIRRARTREIEVLTRLAMLRAAVGYHERGIAGLKSVVDPFGNGPFELQRVESGFELLSTIDQYGFNGHLLFAEKALSREISERSP